MLIPFGECAVHTNLAREHLQSLKDIITSFEVAVPPGRFAYPRKSPSVVCSCKDMKCWCSPKPDNQPVTAQLIGLSPISSVGCALDWQVGGRGFKPTYLRTVPFPEYITTMTESQ